MYKLNKKIINKIKSKTPKKAEIIEDFKLKTDKKNQLIAFFKPETFLNKDEKHLENILNLAFTKFKEFNLEIAGVAYFSGTALLDKAIMDKHYGVINRLSKSASKILSKEEKEHVLKTLNITDKNTKILGGHEAHPLSGMTISEFDKYWISSPSTKIKSGFYVRPMEVNHEQIVVVNGFHPQQLAHYTNEDRHMILMLVNSNTSWQTIREEMMGESFPEKAKETSIRGGLFKDPAKYGFKTVGIENNVMHISAGPTEAVFEMDNFLSTTFNLKTLSEALLPSKLIAEGFSEAVIQEFITTKEIHDELEHKDTNEAITLLKKKKKN